MADSAKPEPPMRSDYLTAKLDLQSRFLGKKASRRKLALWAGLAATPFVSAWAIWVDPPWNRDVEKHFLVWLIIIMTPFAMFAMAARLPWGRKRWPRLFVVRPFTTIRTNPEMSGSAVSSLLDREMGEWFDISYRKTKVSDSGAGPTFSIGGTSVSFDWLWNRVRRFIIGNREVFIDGLLLDDKRPYRVLVWNSESVETWREDVGKGPLAENLISAVRKLSFNILADVDPKRAAAIDSIRWRDSEAVALMPNVDELTDEELPLMLEIYNDGEFLTEAADILPRLYARRGAANTADARMYEAKIDVKRGHFEKARGLFDMVRRSGQGAEQSADLQRMIAETYLFEYKLEDAAREYTLAQRGSLAAAWGFAGLGTFNEEKEDWWDELSAAVEPGLSGDKREKVRTSLSVAKGSLLGRARCYMLGRIEDPERSKTYQEEAAKDIQNAMLIHNLWISLDDGRLQDRLNEAASLAVTMARNNFDQEDIESAKASISDAIQSYDAALGHIESDIALDPRNMEAQANLAWCYFGRATAFRLRFNLQGPREEQAAEESGHEPDQPTPNPENASSEQPDAIAVKPDVSAVKTLAKLYYSLLDRDRAEFDKLYTDAWFRYPGEKCLPHLWRAAESMATALIRKQGPEALRIASTFSAEARPCEYKNPLMAPVPEGPVRGIRPKAALDAEETGVLVEVLYQQMYRRLVLQGDEDFTAEMERLWFDAEVEVAAEKAEQHFMNMEPAERRSAAEALYGLACLAAIKGDGKNAADFLMKAGRRAGEKTLAYRNRAIFDKDFDEVRSHPNFAAFMKWPPAAGQPVTEDSGGGS